MEGIRAGRLFARMHSGVKRGKVHHVARYIGIVAELNFPDPFINNQVFPEQYKVVEERLIKSFVWATSNRERGAWMANSMDARRFQLGDMVHAVDREIERLVSAGLDVYVHGEPEEEFDEFRRIYSIRQEISFRESQEASFILLDGCTDQAVDKLVDLIGRRVNKAVDEVCRRYVKEFKDKYK